jgi:spermidine synthase
VELALALFGGFAPVAMYAAFGFFESHFHLVQYVIAGGIGFLIGSEIPFASRINEQFRGAALPQNLAHIFLADYAGGFLGAIVFTKFLMPKFPLTEMSFLLAGLLVATAFVNYAYFAERKRPLHLVWFAAALALVVVGYMRNRDWNVALEQQLYADRIVYTTTSPYQRIVLQQNPVRNEYRLTLNGALQFSSLDEGRYHDFLVHVPMLFAGNRVKVLVLGGGDGLGLRELLKYPNVERIVLVDLDPAMIAFASTHPTMSVLNRGAFRDARVGVVESGAVTAGERQVVELREARPRARRLASPAVRVAEVKVINVDADRFVSEIRDVFDVVIVDFPDPRSIELAKLYSKEFYLKLRRVMATGAIAAVQSTSVYYSREAYLMIGRTLEAAGLHTLRYHHDVPSFGDWGWHLAWKDERPPSAMREALRAGPVIGVPTDYLTTELVAGSVVFGKGVLSTDDSSINTLMEPRLLDAYLKSWVVD